MPYSSVAELPPAVKKLPAKRQRQWLAVFNSEYESHHDEGRAAASAWAAVKREDEAGDIEKEDLPVQGSCSILNEPGRTDMEEQKKADETKICFTFPITKVDKEKREIEGIATAERVDKQGEILDYQASKEAFQSWAGNIREMHQPIAAGRRLHVEFNDDLKTIKVRGRVSKGAPNTWEKILDGTLTDYSVGGERQLSTVKSASEIPKEAFVGLVTPPSLVRHTTKWSMSELSLVDAGALPGTSFQLVKSVDGRPTATEILEDLVDLEAEKAVLSSKQRANLPKSSFAYVDKDGKGHYPIKDSQGNCDATHVRNALSRAAQQIKAGGAGAEIARKAMPKIKACAKKLKIGQFKMDALGFLLTNDVTEISLDDGTEIRQDTPIEADILVGISEVAKEGARVMVMKSMPTDFMTAYERYQGNMAYQQVYDVISVLGQVLCGIAFDTDLSDSQKKKMVANSVSQFVDIFTEAASEATAKSGAGESRGSIEKKAEGNVAEKENEKKETTQVDTPKAFGAEDMKKVLGEFVSSDNFGAVLQKAVEPVAKKVDELATNVAAIDGRVKKIESLPSERPMPTLRAVSRDGSSMTLAKKDTGELVLTEGETQYDLPTVKTKIAEIESNLSKLEPSDPRRKEQELAGFRLHRIRKILEGDRVWR